MELTYEHLLGRNYEVGVVHCWKLVRDFYSDNFQIDLGDYVIPKDWDADRLNLIEEIYQREGFFKVEDWSLKTLRPGDLLCIAVQSQNANHFVINLGNNQLLHHPLMQLSRVEPMRDFWRKQACYVLRHPLVPDLTPVYPDVTIKELADARYQVQAEA